MRSNLDRSIRCLVFCTALCASHVKAGDLYADYTPTRWEWLEVSLTQAIVPWVGIWSHRVSVLVVVNPRSGEVFITLTSANGSPSLSDKAQAEYLKTARTRAEAVLARYDWASGVKLIVQFA